MTIETRQEAPEADASHYFRRNVLALGADSALFMLAIGFASPQTLIPAFAERLGAPNIVIGAIPALMTVGWMLPSIFAANHARMLPRKLPFILKYTVFERLSYPLLGVAAIWLAPTAPGLTLALMLILLAIMTATGGILMPAWLDMIGKLIPTTSRGRFFAISTSIASFFAFLASGGVSWILSRYGSPLGYGICFLTAGVFLFISYGFLALTREPAGPVSTERMATMAYLRRLPGLVQRDPNLARFLGARALVVSGNMATGFYTVYGLKALGAADVQVGLFTAFLLAAQTIGNLAFGWIADRRGHLLVLTMGAVGSVLASSTALLASDISILYLAFLFSGLAIAAQNVSGMTIGLEFGPDEDRATYVAINNSSVAPFNLIAPLLGGLLADAVGFSALFALAATLALAGALTFRLLVQDPRRASA